MKYAIIGAGGTGGTLGFYLTKAEKDVTLIARGSHLEAMQKQGLTMRQLWDGKEETIPVKACRMEEYTEQPDVILVCVKGYSLTDLIPDIRRIAGFCCSRDSFPRCGSDPGYPQDCRTGDSSSSNPEYLWNRRQITERISGSHRTGWMHLCISGDRGAGSDPSSWQDPSSCFWRADSF